jgi:hypothetical protein
MIRRALAAAALVLAWAGPAAAKVVEQGGYKYVQISLTGLWEGFFLFLGGIAFSLVGLFLFVVWRRSTRQAAQPFAVEGREDDDGRVF